MDRKCMVVNRNTYGYFYPDSSTFECTHGGWSGKVTFIDDTTCTINVVNGVCSYKWIEEIPDDYIV